MYGAGVCALGVAITIAGLADPEVDGSVALVVGVAIILAGVTMLVAAAPGAGRRQSSRAEVRSTSEGVMIEGETMDTTVPWTQFTGVKGELRGTSLEVWLERTGGQRLPVRALNRRSLLSEAARLRALAEIERLDIRLKQEQRERLPLA